MDEQPKFEIGDAVYVRAASDPPEHPGAAAEVVGVSNGFVWVRLVGLNGPTAVSVFGFKASLVKPRTQGPTLARAEQPRSEVVDNRDLSSLLMQGMTMASMLGGPGAGLILLRGETREGVYYTAGMILGGKNVTASSADLPETLRQLLESAREHAVEQVAGLSAGLALLRTGTEPEMRGGRDGTEGL